jgi:2-polyprenyl-3-methyl-5-hydroxy-6-metoxy-1,4-benzoquinol methylase
VGGSDVETAGHRGAAISATRRGRSHIKERVVVYSKVMREGDWKAEEMSGENSSGLQVEAVVEALGGWDPVQHPHRRWEYATMMCAYRHWLKDYQRPPQRKLVIADVGCGIGLSPALMLKEGNSVVMYEPWVYGDESTKAFAQLTRICTVWPEKVGNYHSLLRRPLCELIDDDKNRYDAAMCISTLEHIGEYARAWKDLLSMVKPGGLVFITTDFAENRHDHYRHANLRAGRMFNDEIYRELVAAGRAMNFTLLGGSADYHWSEECRLCNDYGFASLAMVRQK